MAKLTTFDQIIPEQDTCKSDIGLFFPVQSIILILLICF